MASKKLRALNSADGEEMKMDMSPMIDMVFLLLVFFIVVSTPMVVKLDADVDPAVAYNAADPEDKRGRIVVNVRADGKVYPVDFEAGELVNEPKIEQYVLDLKNKYNSQNQNIKPRLHLRADKNAAFKHSRKVIKAAADAGVTDIIFSAYNFEN